MVTLIARLCALCAVCALIQTAMGEADEQGGLRMIGGLLMLHLVLSGVRDWVQALAAERNVMRIFELLMG